MALLIFALAIWNCTSLVFGDPPGVCPTLRVFEVSDPETVGLAVAAVSGVGLIATWAPRLNRRRRQRMYQPERMLVENIRRLPEPYTGYLSGDAEDAAEVTQLRRAVEVVEMAFETDSATRSMTSEWMRLLLEANRLHNEGTLPTEEFKRLNTRLLELVTATSKA